MGVFRLGIVLLCTIVGGLACRPGSESAIQGKWTGKFRVSEARANAFRKLQRTEQEKKEYEDLLDAMEHYEIDLDVRSNHRFTIAGPEFYGTGAWEISEVSDRSGYFVFDSIDGEFPEVLESPQDIDGYQIMGFNVDENHRSLTISVKQEFPFHFAFMRD